ncbi:Chromatin modification-related protein YNG2 [Debaryomyces fabryi]|uniref:Chromatin modification-related protein n=1 Tax=Debaryomyces fabryi TaxID=58627 RepID=A0A0V1PX61_9ASCO|nr:Chromatin modification-related protein YNG2 [Debaryomyces fabryi]KSA00652.1 Chromatin modification-related protein YNG2 [Debaryomyces fabryi]CUM45941.1 unnamed protein product [Debaryomyces fabryi]
MDTTTVLDKYTQDLSNLPLEVKHLLQELKNKDVQLQEARKRYQTKDNQIHKFIRANGTLTKHPKEQQIYNKIEEDMVLVKKLQKEKILLANTALFLVSKHLSNFETDIAKLERDELLPPVDNVMELDTPSSDMNSVINGLSDNLSGTTTPRGHSASTPVADSAANSMLRKAQKRKHALNIKGTSGLTKPSKRMKSEDFEDKKYDSDSLSRSNEGPGNNGEDADNNLYCFCQRVSFGEMIGCDNDDCKFEWFHWSCVGITAPPKDDEIWYCPDCAPKMEKRKKKRK